MQKSLAIASFWRGKAWMAGTSPATTVEAERSVREVVRAVQNVFDPHWVKRE
jgi:hypothetical protein